MTECGRFFTEEYGSAYAAHVMTNVMSNARIIAVFTIVERSFT
jgi:hypothetical protein